MGVTAAEFFVVYLSSGAPFGVLVFFSRWSPSIVRRIGESVLAALFWPVVALSWTHRRLLLRHRGRQPRPSAVPSPTLPQEPVLVEYWTLTKALVESRTSTAKPSAELFEVAGHSNPYVAAVCAQRRRDGLLARRQKTVAAALVDWTIASVDRPRILAIAQHCRELGDEITAEIIEQRLNSLGTQPPPELANSVSKQVQLAA